MISCGYDSREISVCDSFHQRKQTRKYSPFVFSANSLLDFRLTRVEHTCLPPPCYINEHNKDPHHRPIGTHERHVES